MEPHSRSFSLDDPFPVTEEMKERFRREGFIKIKNVLKPEEIAGIEPEITAKVEEYRKGSSDLRGYDLQPFIQLVGLWKKSEPIRQFAFSKRFAKLAADLMGVRGVRLYIDQVFYKLPGGSLTVAHQDLSYSPLATENACALWIPLRPVPLEMGPLAFHRGSHKAPLRPEGRITPEISERLAGTFESQGYPAVHEAYELGEVSFHYGWTVHAARPNQTQDVRKAFAINFFEDGSRLSNPTPNQMDDWKTVCPEARIGEVIDDPCTPVLWRY